MTEISKSTEFMAKVSKYAPYRLQRFLYQISGGKLMNKTPGGVLKILLLTTTGRKSGLPRTHPVMYYPVGETYVIIASNSGSDKPPLWYLNLRAQPEAAVQIGKATQQVKAEDANAAERARLWPILVEKQPVFAAYQKFTDRQIPVIILRPVKA
jgi:deazaflavin-dependent oxidoreductase (nitroreductase family)